jgi:hypothetical protein
MRIFWSIIGLLVIVTAVVFLLPAGGGGNASSAPAASQPDSQPTRQASRPEREEQAPRQPREIARETPSETEPAPTSTEPSTETVETADAQASDSLDLDTALGLESESGEEQTTLASAPATEVPEILAPIDEAVPDTDEAVRGEYTYTSNAFVGPPSLRGFDEVADDGESSGGSYLDQLRDAKRRHSEQKRAEAEATGSASSEAFEGEWAEVQVDDGVTLKQRASDGAYLIDDRFLVTGEGTKDKPYELTWDMLYSVRETYRPRKGKEQIPAWTSWLDGSWVRITGFMATAIFAEDVDELLIMKNEWDGCCIGIPPTPYDAVEVTLNEKIKLTAGMMTFGTITGKLEVEPYLVRNWLVGLYLLENGTVESSGF